jgi:DNA-binding transcriptional regulator GbsR (MarR family)
MNKGNIENMQNIEAIFFSIGRKVCRLIGWKETIGHVFMLLYVRNRPLSLDDISEITNLSKSNVWGIIQQLLRLGAVNKAWNTENRKDYFVVERDFDLILSKGVLPLLKTKVDFLDSYLESAKKELDSILNDLESEDLELYRNYKIMLKNIVSQNNKVQYIIDNAFSLK